MMNAPAQSMTSYQRTAPDLLGWQQANAMGMYGGSPDFSASAKGQPVAGEGYDLEAAIKEFWEQAFGGGAGGDTPLGWATLEQRKLEFERNMEHLAQVEAARLAQQRQQMASQMGQAITGLQSQQWATGLPWALPDDTTFVPGFEPGGPVGDLARMGGSVYTPPRAQQWPAPTKAEMEQWLADALARFG